MQSKNTSARDSNAAPTANLIFLVTTQADKEIGHGYIVVVARDAASARSMTVAHLCCKFGPGIGQIAELTVAPYDAAKLPQNWLREIPIKNNKVGVVFEAYVHGSSTDFIAISEG